MCHSHTAVKLRTCPAVLALGGLEVWPASTSAAVLLPVFERRSTTAQMGRAQRAPQRLFYQRRAGAKIFRPVKSFEDIFVGTGA